MFLQVLHVVGHYCHNLVELHVNHCNEVRDGGVRNLLFGTTEAAVQCPDLVKLDLEATKVTVASVQVRICIKNTQTNATEHRLLTESSGLHESGPNGLKIFSRRFSNVVFFLQLALLSLPKLQVLESDLLLEAMNNLHEDEFFRLDEQVERAKQHRLTRLGPMSLAGDVEKLGQSLSVAAAYCPNVNEVVMYSYANDESLLTVSRFERLRSMSLLQCFEGISLESGILPLLQIRGPQLHTLVMEVPEIDVPALAYFCPNVRKLGLEFQSCSSETHLAVKVAKNWKPFSHMQWLRVAYQQGASVGQSDLLMLLSHSPDLRYLHLNKLNDLTNEIMATVLEANPMENLENLTLQDCHHITVDAVWPFLLTENELRTLELENCAEITLRDATQMRREIANQKSDLELKWT